MSHNLQRFDLPVFRQRGEVVHTTEHGRTAEIQRPKTAYFIGGDTAECHNLAIYNAVA